MYKNNKINNIISDRDSLILKSNQDLYNYTKSGDFHKVKFMLECQQVYDLNIKDESSDNILTCVIDSQEIKTEIKKIQFLKLFVDYKVNINLQNKVGQTVLHLAYKYKYFEVLSYLYNLPTCEYLVFDYFNKLPIDYLFHNNLSEVLSADEILTDALYKDLKESLNPEKERIISDIITEINKNIEFTLLKKILGKISENSHLFIKKDEDVEITDTFVFDYINKNKWFTSKIIINQREQLQKQQEGIMLSIEKQFVKVLDSLRIIPKKDDFIVSINSFLDIQQRNNQMLPREFDFKITHLNAILPRDSIINKDTYIKGSHSFEISCIKNDERDDFNKFLLKALNNKMTIVIETAINVANETKSADEVIKEVEIVLGQLDENDSKYYKNLISRCQKTNVSLKNLLWNLLILDEEFKGGDEFIFESTKIINPQFGAILNYVLNDDKDAIQKYFFPTQLKQVDKISFVLDLIFGGKNYKDLHKHAEYQTNLSYADNLINIYEVREDLKFTVKYILAKKEDWGLHNDDAILNEYQIFKIHNSIFDIEYLCRIISEQIDKIIVMNDNNEIAEILCDGFKVLDPVRSLIMKFFAKEDKTEVDFRDDDLNEIYTGILNFYLPDEITIKLLLEANGYHPKYIKIFTEIFKNIQKDKITISNILMGIFESYILDIEYRGLTPESSNPIIEFGKENYNQGVLYNNNTNLYSRVDSYFIVLIENLIHRNDILSELMKVYDNIVKHETYTNLVFIKQYLFEEINFYINEIKKLVDLLLLEYNVLYTQLSLIGGTPLIGTPLIGTQEVKLDIGTKKIKDIIENYKKNIVGLDIKNFLKSLSILNFYAFNEKRYFYVNSLENINNETIISFKSSFTTVRCKSRGKTTDDIPSDFLSQRFLLEVLKEDMIKKIVTKKENVRYVEEILNTYLNYVVSCNTLEFFKKIQVLKTGCTTLDFDKFYSSKTIDYDNLKALFKEDDSKNEIFYKLSEDYFSTENEWDFEKNYFYFDNKKINDILNLKNKIPFIQSKDKILTQILNQQNFLLIQKFLPYYKTNSKFKDDANRIYRIHREIFTNKNIISVIVEQIYQDFKKTIDSYIPQNIEQQYTDFLQEFSRSLILHDIFDDSLTETQLSDTVTEFYSEKIILKKQSKMYKKIHELMTKYVKEHLLPFYYNSYKTINPTIQPNENYELSEDLIKLILKYPEEDKDITIEIIKETLQNSLNEINTDDKERIEFFNDKMFTLFTRYLEDLRRLASNYIRLYTNTIIMKYIIKLLE